MAEDLKLGVERRIDAPPEVVWRVMTERMAEWWCPLPWTVEVEEMDRRSGGRVAMTMRGPDGEAMPNEGVILEYVPGVRWVSTDAFTAGWRPSGPFMVGTWEVEPAEGGTLYRAYARHWTAEAYEQHRSMGFEQGWGVVADQLKALAEAAVKGEAK
jgi:uncharacterized protein YndB with AHSA1/START domain